MRLRSGLVAFALSSLVSAVIIAGCSADGSSGADPEETPSTTSDDASTILPGDGDDTNPPPKKDSGSTDPKPTEDDAGNEPVKDSGTDSGTDLDSGSTGPKEGDPCTGAQIFERACGNCGVQKAFCTSTDGGATGVVGKYGDCSEAADACKPGTIVEEACGNCGKITKSCTKQCVYTTTKCSGEPADSCSPNSVKWDTGACGTGQYVSSTCGTTCQWGAWTGTCVTPTTPNKMTISNKVGNVVSLPWTLSSPNPKRPSATTKCPATSVSTLGGPGVVVEISNPTSQTAEITAYQSASQAGELDLYIWAYDGASLPMTDKDALNCLNKSADSCTAPTTAGGTTSGTLSQNICGNSSANYNFASLDKLTIQPNGKILVYSAAAGTSTKIGDGSFVLNLRTDKLQP